MGTPDTRRANINWRATNDGGTVTVWEQVQVAVLMDIRDELQRLNRLLHCGNFIGIPQTLTTIARQTRRRKRKRK